jgi:hypothetical protein
MVFNNGELKSMVFSNASGGHAAHAPYCRTIAGGCDLLLHLARYLQRLLPPAAKNLFEKRFAGSDLQKLLIMEWERMKQIQQDVTAMQNKSFCGVQGRFLQKEPLAAGGKTSIIE